MTPFQFTSIARRLIGVLTVSVVAALPVTASAAEAARSVKLQVNGMVCAFCAQGIEKRLKALPAAGPIFIDLRNKVVAIEQRPGQTLDAERVANEVRESGYEVVATEAVAATVAQIRTETRAANPGR
ncbi:heavy-metal-associated domain-containing protein [Aquabacterium lacunae]|uniref:Heavy-metal-associated domain-containing protein n=1 Tax=Aquabacterium lacunae TaxID=2528630 RepID=A0A4Q9GX06_9BURK|nr:heavy metal-associated domain-containing protein [Aquabacterium lacunae]TBO30123.1 heavy-metal-associated domain-containing protein [Aquabacterium lacunae]